MPASWRPFLNRISYYRILPEEDQKELEALTQIFIAEKQFEGCSGLQINDEIRVTIAGQACILLLHRKHDYFGELKSIVVYPSAYQVKKEALLEAGVIEESVTVRAGEAWVRGPVVLAWDEVLHDSSAGQQHNLVLHEFAHLLDQEDGHVDGAPLLEEHSRYASWEEIMKREYAAHSAAVSQDLPTDIDDYGAESPAEFFAVVTESFFQLPVEMRSAHPSLYEELKDFYRQDPARLRQKETGGG